MALPCLIEETAFLSVAVTIPLVPGKVVRGRERASGQPHGPCGTESVQGRRRQGVAPSSDACGMGRRPWSGPRGKVQNVVGQEGRGARHVGEARKVVDVEEDETERCLDDIQTINVEPKYFAGAERQLA